MTSPPNEIISPFSTTSESQVENPAMHVKAMAIEANTDTGVNKNRKVLHFCDGTLDEGELDEDEPDKASQLTVDPSTLSWGPWMVHQASNAGTKTLQVVDYVGESLASFFGITTPKYQYEIDEYEIMRAEEEEEKKTEDLEMGGWTRGTSKVSDYPSNQSTRVTEVVYDGPIKLQPNTMQS